MSTFEQQALAQQVLDYIEAHPEEHDQMTWGKQTACGTSMCIAGTAAFLAGVAKFVQYDNKDVPEVEAIIKLDANLIDSKESDPFVKVGADLLGLDIADADRLFFCWDEEKAKEALRYVANGKQIDWQKVYHQFAGE